MRDLYSDDYESVAGDAPDRFFPDSLRRLAGATVFLALITTMAFWSWRLGTRDAAEVPIIRAMEGPARVQPEDPGGLEAAHQGLEVNSVLAGQPAPLPREALPPAPTPVALAEEDGPQGELILAAPARLVEETLQAGDDLRMPAQEEVPEATEIAPAPEFAPQPALDTAPPTELAALSEPVAAATGLRPRGRPANLAVARAPSDVPRAPAPASAPAPEPAAREVSGLAPGTRLVQLGAYDSEDLTRAAWSQLVARNGDLLGGKSLFVERTTANARVFYRLRVAGFENTEATRVMCEELRARGIDCIPVTLQ
jgi:hypothetical protein